MMFHSDPNPAKSTDMSPLEVYRTLRADLAAGNSDTIPPSRKPHVINLQVVAVSDLTVACLFYLDGQNLGRLIMTVEHYLLLTGIVNSAVLNSGGWLEDHSDARVFERWLEQFIE